MPKFPLQFRAFRQVQGSRSRPAHLLPRVLVRRHRLRPVLSQRPLCALVIWINAMNRMTYEICLQDDSGLGWVDLDLRCSTILLGQWVTFSLGNSPNSTQLSCQNSRTTLYQQHISVRGSNLPGVMKQGPRRA